MCVKKSENVFIIYMSRECLGDEKDIRSIILNDKNVLKYIVGIYKSIRGRLSIE